MSRVALRLTRAVKNEGQKHSKGCARSTSSISRSTVTSPQKRGTVSAAVTSRDGKSMPNFITNSMRPLEYPDLPNPETPPLSPESVRKILSCHPVDEGSRVELKFSDGGCFVLHSAWLLEASQTSRPKHSRRSAVASAVELARGGSQMRVVFQSADGEVGSAPSSFEASWLHAFAPFVGRPVGGSVSASPRPDFQSVNSSSLFQGLRSKREPWLADTDMPTFSAEALTKDIETQVAFLENMITKGIASITGLGVPEDLSHHACGVPLEEVVAKVIGNFNQHPVRSTTYAVLRKDAQTVMQGVDYDLENPLSMHTDHSTYDGTPGFLQFLYQARGNVKSKVCDGLALTEYMREHHPAEFKLLSTVNITHSSRNQLYTSEGSPRNVFDSKSAAPAPFELCHTHPVLQIGEDGQLDKVVQSETKRGISAIPYDVYEEYLAAYQLWLGLVESKEFMKHFDWPEGTAIVTNNWRVLHGRATQAPGEPRVMCTAYMNKKIVENRYRLLKQKQTMALRPEIDEATLTAVPNEVLPQFWV